MVSTRLGTGHNPSSPSNGLSSHTPSQPDSRYQRKSVGHPSSPGRPLPSPRTAESSGARTMTGGSSDYSAPLAVSYASLLCSHLTSQPLVSRSFTSLSMSARHRNWFPEPPSPLPAGSAPGIKRYVISRWLNDRWVCGTVGCGNDKVPRSSPLLLDQLSQTR